MALRDHFFADSCERYATANLLEKWTAEFTQGGYTGTVLGSFGRDGRRGLRITTPLSAIAPTKRGLSKSLVTGDTWGSVSWAEKFSAVQPDNISLMAFYGGSKTITLMLGVDGRLFVIEGENGNVFTTVYGTSTATVNAGVHNQYELQVGFDASAGTIKLYLNGDPTPTINLSGLNTGSGWTSVFFGERFLNNIHTSFACNYDICDVVIRSSLTDLGTAVLGDCEVIYLESVSDGNYSQFTPSAGVVNADMVNEALEDGDTTTVTSLASGNRDTYVADTLSPATGVVHALQVVSVAKKSSSGTGLLNGTVRSSGTDYDGEATVALTTGYQHIRTVFMPSNMGGTLNPTIVNEPIESGPVIG